MTWMTDGAMQHCAKLWRTRICLVEPSTMTPLTACFSWAALTFLHTSIKYCGARLAGVYKYFIFRLLLSEFFGVLLLHGCYWFVFLYFCLFICFNSEQTWIDRYAPCKTQASLPFDLSGHPDQSVNGRFTLAGWTADLPHYVHDINPTVFMRTELEYGTSGWPVCRLYVNLLLVGEIAADCSGCVPVGEHSWRAPADGSVLRLKIEFGSAGQSSAAV
jgi:hypothetical protein